MSTHLSFPLSACSIKCVNSCDKRYAKRSNTSPNATPTSTPETGWESAYYIYSSSHPHAVSSVQRDVGTDTFSYDNAGNMTSRSEAGTSWTQGFDEEGRLDGISDGSDAWEFIYDGDGVRVKQDNPDGTTTLFLGGGSYEVLVDGETTTVKKYYAAGGQRVMRDVDGLHYLLTDHLGSVVGVLDSNGDLETDERYLPFGGLRDTSGITETDFAFTGQRNLSDVGLMDYNARWYSPSIGRFISPDTIVPEPSNPQALNRYAYTNNNPLCYTDPSGHFCVEVGGNVICSEDDDDESMSTGVWYPGYTWVNQDKLKKAGKDMYKMYISFWLAKDAWWWDTFGADGVFDVYDFIGVILYREGKSFLDNIMTEAAVRAFYGSCQAVQGYYGGNCPGNTPYAVLNWIGDVSSSANTYYASISGGKSPELAIEIYSDISTIAAQYAANRFRNPPGAWKTGREKDRPYHWGNLSLYPGEIQDFIALDTNYVFIFVESLPLEDSFLVPSGCVWAHWLNGIGQGYNTNYSCPMVRP